MNSNEQTCEMKLKSATQFNSYQPLTPVLAIVEVVAPTLLSNDDELKGPSVEVALVLDTSSSMSNSMDQLNAILRHILKTTPTTIQTSLISFNSFPTVEWTMQQMSNAAKVMLQPKCNLKATGSTNIATALDVALNQLTKNVSSTRMIILLSDGEPTVGPRKAQDILKKVASHPLFGKTQIFCLGLGTAVDVELLTDLALTTQGRFYHLKNEEDMCRALGDCMGSAVSLVAGDVSVVVTPLMEDECHAQGETQFVIGHMYAEDSRNVLVQIPAECDAYRVRLQYINALSGLSANMSRTFQIDRCGNLNPLEDPAVAVQLLRIECQQAIQRAQEAGEIKELENLKEKLLQGPHTQNPMVQYILGHLSNLIGEPRQDNVKNSLCALQVELATQQTTGTMDGYGSNALRRQFSNAYATIADDLDN